MKKMVLLLLVMSLGTLISCSGRQSEEDLFHFDGALFQNGLIRFRNDEGLFGFLNIEGEEVIPATYDWVGDFNDLGLALVTEYPQMKSNFITVENEFLLEEYVDYVSDFIGDYAIFWDGSVHGIIDKDGEIVYQTEAYTIETMTEEGVIVFRENDLVGLMNLEGDVLVEPVYLGLMVSNTNPKHFIAVNEQEQSGIINESGEIIYPMSDFSLLQTTIEDLYISVNELDDGYRLYGLVSVQDGELVAPFSQREIEFDIYLNRGVPYSSISNEDGLLGVIDQSGAYVLPMEYSSLTGYLNYMFRALIPIFHRGVQLVVEDDVEKIVDIEGNTLYENLDDERHILEYDDEMIVLYNETDRRFAFEYTLIDYDGNVLVEPTQGAILLTYDDSDVYFVQEPIDYTVDSYFVETTMYDYKGRTLKEDFSLTRVGYDLARGYDFHFIQGLMPYYESDTNLLGFMDSSGKTVIEPTFDGSNLVVSNFYPIFHTDGYAVMVDHGKYGVINRNGEVIIPFEYDLIYANPFAQNH